MNPKISRRQAWMKLAVLIADGLPEPLSIGFNSRSDTLISIDFDANEPAFTAWCQTLGSVRTPAHTNNDGTDWLHTAYNWCWYGWTVQMTASSPIAEHEPAEDTGEDLTAVRALAGSTPDGA